MQQIKLNPGEPVSHQGKKYIIIRVVSLETVMAEDAETGYRCQLPIKLLHPFEEKLQPVIPEMDIEMYTEKELQKAQWRYEIIKPILESPGDFELVKEQAAKAKVHYASIYRWIKTYEDTGLVSSLVGRKRDGGRGRSRLDGDVEEIINTSIENIYLTKQRLPIKSVIQQVKKACREQNIRVPHENTIRKRIGKISEEDRVRARFGHKKADEKFRPSRGNFPGADYPLSVVQIDHTLLDVILVDEAYRNPVGRPWLTVAIDVYSRMIVGFYLAFEKPGALATGLCVAHSILPKEIWLSRMDINAEWPCWGIMKKIHLDNAKEFRGIMLSKACLKYGIDIEFRPVKTPNYGGHIERFCGTLSKEIHALPGTTFSNTKQRDGHPSEKMATMTLGELEKWLTTYLLEVYHKKFHSGILTSPVEKFREGLLGSASHSGIGLPPRIFDERRLRLDFMPFEERTVQDYGVAIDHIHYYHDVLRKHVNRVDLTSGKARVKKKYIFRRDPRDISIIYFYDDETNEYHPIPYRDTSKPPMSLWEHREIMKQLEAGGRKNIDELAIFEGYEKLHEQVRETVAKTKSVKKHTRRVLLPQLPIHNGLSGNSKDAGDDQQKKSENKKVIKPFDETEEYGTSQ